jgi:hypothetical protein
VGDEVSETILNIQEVSDRKVGRWQTYDGYTVTTDRQVIALLISNRQSCCEHWGYFMSEDDTDEFVGAALLDLKISDTALNPQKMEANDVGDVYDGDVMFVTLETDRGPLQFVAYNQHNGYYGHTALVSSQQLAYETAL